MRRCLTYGVVAALCAIFVGLVLVQARMNSATYDETSHLPAGYGILRWHDFRMNPDHPPLIKELAALPLLFQPVWPDAIELDPSRQEPESISLRAIQRAWALELFDGEGQWFFGRYLLYGVRDETLARLGVNAPLAVPTTARLDKSDYHNDAEAMLFAGRTMMLLPALLLAGLLFCWARELHGLAGGLFALTLFCFDPNFLAHSGLVTNDVTISAFCFGTVYFFWRTCREISLANVILTLLFFGLSFAAKFSAVLLLPICGVLAIARVSSRDPWRFGKDPARPLVSLHSKIVALAILLAGCGVASLVCVWAAYGFRWSAARDPVQAGQAEVSVFESMNRTDLLEKHARRPGYLPIERMVHRRAAIQALSDKWPAGPPEDEIERQMGRASIDLMGEFILFAQRSRILPEGYVYVFAYNQTHTLFNNAFLRGEYSTRGFWNYFLWTLLLKTPLPTMAAIAAALGVVAFRKRWTLDLAFILLPVVIYLLFCLRPHRFNIGHRHLLPIYPFLFVLCAGLVAVWQQWHPRIRRWSATAALAAIVVSCFVVFAPPWRPAVVFPHCLAYFNEFAGGPRNGYKSLVDSNVDWGQDLKYLRRWFDRHQVNEPINLCYFGMADPLYHGIPHVPLPGTDYFRNGEPFDKARILGYLAISATNLQGVYLDNETRAAWKRFLQRAKLVDVVGYSIFIYEIPP